MKKVFIFLMALSLFTACDNNKFPDKKKDFTLDDDDKKKNDDNEERGNWSSSDKSKFNRECLSGFSEENQAMGRKICPCVLEKYQKKYSSYSEVEEANDEAEVKRVALQCKKQLAGDDDEDDFSKPDENEDDNGGGWTSTDRKKFKRDSMTGFANGNEELGEKICPCALSKYEKKYRSYREVEAKNDEDEGRRIGAQCKQEIDE